MFTISIHSKSKDSLYLPEDFAMGRGNHKHVVTEVGAMRVGLRRIVVIRRRRFDSSVRIRLEVRGVDGQDDPAWPGRSLFSAFD